MLPPNAYVTLEHEYVLVFRKGGTREFDPGAEERYQAAYFWEERNEWFSDVWTDVRGDHQTLDHDELRERSGAFPFEIPYRLINMYSTYGDTVLDPFWGTGTTSLAAMVAGRNSVGYELRGEFAEVFDDRLGDVCEFSRSVARERLARHREFVADVRADGESLDYESEYYEFPVRTRQERRLRLYEVSEIDETDAGYRAIHRPVEEGSSETAASE
jgi:DNA modification methylase